MLDFFFLVVELFKKTCQQFCSKCNIFILTDDEEKKSLLKAEVKKIMEKILNELSAIESQLLSGEIRFHHLDIILNSRMNFEEVLALIHDNKVKKGECVYTVQSITSELPF